MTVTDLITVVTMAGSGVAAPATGTLMTSYTIYKYLKCTWDVGSAEDKCVSDCKSRE